MTGVGGVLGWNVAYTLQKASEANHRLNNWNTAEPIIYEIDNQDRPNSFAVFNHTNFNGLNVGLNVIATTRIEF